MLHFTAPRLFVVAALLGTIACQPESLTPPPNAESASAALSNGAGGDLAYDADGPGNEDERADAKALVAYLDSVWTLIETWRVNPSAAAAATIPAAEAIEAFESLINAHAGTSETNTARQLHDATIMGAPIPTGGWSTGTWTGTQAVATYNAIVTSVNGHIATGGTGRQLAVVDLAVGGTSASPALVLHTLTQSATAHVPLDLDLYRWGHESEVPPTRRLVFQCTSNVVATDILTDDLSSHLKFLQPRRRGTPVAVVMGVVSITEDASIPPAPFIFRRSTYSYPTGATAPYVNRGQYKTHTDLGREELCFAGNKHVSYVDDGAELFQFTLANLVPIANVKVNGRLLQYQREPFDVSVNTHGKIAANPPAGTTSGWERAHRVIALYGGFVPYFDEELGPVQDVLDMP